MYNVKRVLPAKRSENTIKINNTNIQTRYHYNIPNIYNTMGFIIIIAIIIIIIIIIVVVVVVVVVVVGGGGVVRQDERFQFKFSCLLNITSSYWGLIRQT